MLRQALGSEIEDKAKERDRAVAKMQKELQQQLKEQQAAYDATELAMRREARARGRAAGPSDTCRLWTTLSHWSTYCCHR